MVFEGFWDLYCKKPATPDLNSKKLEGWINRILLKVPTTDPPVEEGALDDDGNPIPAAAPGLPVKAVVRVRIPFKRPEPAEGEGGDGAE